MKFNRGRTSSINTLRKISIRKALREKGTSICIILALFLTTVMLVMIFSAVFFVRDALEELAAKNASWTADAAFIVNDEQYEKICRSSLVADVSYGLHIGEIYDSGGFPDIELVSYEEKMAHWMKCYPTEGRMPQKENEIAVPYRYLEEHGVQYAENKTIDVSYTVAGMEFTDTFILVGAYDRNIHSKNVMLLSKEFYNIVWERLEQSGKDNETIMFKTAEVMFVSSGNIRETTYRLMEEIGFNPEQEGFTYNNEASSLNDIGVGLWIVLACIILFVILNGYLFISNVFRISVLQDTRFYGKLTTIGMTEKEIGRIIFLKNNILYIIAVLPALVVGYIFSGFILPDILNSFFTFQVKGNCNYMIFVMALIFSYVTLIVSERTPVNMAKGVSPIEMRKHMGEYRQIKEADNKRCLNKLAFRNLQSNKKKAVKICISIAVSILLANCFYAAAAGFDEKEYVSSNLDADYTIAKKTFFTEKDRISRENIRLEELGGCRGLSGVAEEGGGSVCYVNLNVPDDVWTLYDKIVGDENYNNNNGEMLTYAYGLDDIMVKKMKVREGNIDLDLYHTGKYVLIDALNDEGENCFRIGDSIRVPFANGDEGSYTVMAVVELPYNLSYRSKYMASSNLFLPMSEWRDKVQKNDYYMYTYDVEKEYQDIWDRELANMAGLDNSLMYISARTEADEVEGYIKELKIIGLVLSMILLGMGIMNFMNCMAGSIYSRRREFAILQSMGMKKSELIGALIAEGALYIMGGFIVGVILAVPGVYILIERIMAEPYLQYHFHAEVYLLFAALGGIAAAAVPCILYIVMDRKEKFMERIRAGM